MEETRTNLIVNYLPQKLSDKEFHSMFSSIGPLTSSKVVRNKETQYSFGFGFADYKSPEDAQKAILKLNNMQVQHKRLKVAYASPTAGDDIKETNLYITGIPRTYTALELGELFADYGPIANKNILTDKMTGFSKGVGFVTFVKKDDADAAINAMNGFVPEGSNQPLKVKKAAEQSKAKSAYEAGYKAAMAAVRGERPGNNFGQGHMGMMNAGFNQFSAGGGMNNFGGPMRRMNNVGGNNGAMRGMQKNIGFNGNMNRTAPYTTGARGGMGGVTGGRATSYANVYDEYATTDEFDDSDANEIMDESDMNNYGDQNQYEGGRNFNRQPNFVTESFNQFDDDDGAAAAGSFRGGFGAGTFGGGYGNTKMVNARPSQMRAFGGGDQAAGRAAGASFKRFY